MARFVVAVDFDGTIVEHRFPEIGAPVPGTIEWLQAFAAAGAHLVLWTIRADNPTERRDYLAEAVAYCDRVGLRFAGINRNPAQLNNSPKVYAQVYIDDAAAGCPLLAGSRGGVRPMVDWDIVGPLVMSQIARRR